jgi:hypothetical protein
MNAPLTVNILKAGQRKRRRSQHSRKFASLTAAFLAVIPSMITKASAAGICLAAVTSLNDLYVYTGDREQALMQDFDRNEGSDTKSYWIMGISVDELIAYMSADFSKWRTPDRSWSDGAIFFEFSSDPQCVAVLDARELFVQSATSNGFVVRTLQEFEYERIIRSLEEARSVYL